MDKRTFLKTSSLLGLSGLVDLSGLNKLMASVAHIPTEKLAADEDFWLQIRKGFKLKNEYINLENGITAFSQLSFLQPI